jgi:predicted DCC family thiol-disulfide oxidoreductase YuxK
VRVILKNDTQKKFVFASLQGETAAKRLQGSSLLEPPYETMILIEESGRVYTYAQASFRIAWHLGGKFIFLGLLSFLPGFLFKPFYRVVAKRRHRLFTETVMIDQSLYQDRFFP